MVADVAVVVSVGVEVVEPLVVIVEVPDDVVVEVVVELTAEGPVVAMVTPFGLFSCVGLEPSWPVPATVVQGEPGLAAGHRRMRWFR